jgi:hypothetical protein
MTISKKVLSLQFFGVLLLLSEHVFGLSHLCAITVFIAMLYFYLRGKLQVSLFLILLFSVLSKGGVNIFTFNIVGLNLFYLGILVILVISTCFRGEKLFKVSKVAFIYLILVSFVLSYSVLNLASAPLFFVKDFIILVFLPIVFFILFKKLSSNDILFAVYNIIAIKIITSFIMYLSGLTLLAETDLMGAMVIDNADELSAFYLIFLISSVLFVKNERKWWLVLALFVSLIGLLFYGLGFWGLGSQVMLMIAIVFALYAIKNKYFLIGLFPLLLLLLPLLGSIENELILYKLKNITDLFSNLDIDSVYLIPHSPQVRVIELINILSYPWYNIVFGHGIGGSFTDTYFPFNKYLGSWDFSHFEITTRVFFNPHNIAFALLKLGLMWWGFVVYLFYKSVLVKNVEVKVFLLVATFVLLLNFGYAIKSSLLLGLVFIVLHNFQKENIVEKEN